MFTVSPKLNCMMNEQVEIRTKDGIADAVLTRSDGDEKRPGILVLTDIMGYRPAYADIANHIAGHGYVVLTPNIFFRSGKPPIFEFPVDWEKESVTKRRKEITTALTNEAALRDGSEYFDFLAAQDGVASGPMGVVGFCYTGRIALQLAATRPDVVGAAASFHGGGLLTDDATSPHWLLPKVKARLYFGHATNVGSMPAEAIDRFESALGDWGGEYQSETYPAGHGWMIAGRPVHDPEQADRGFKKLIELFDETLKS